MTRSRSSFFCALALTAASCVGAGSGFVDRFTEACAAGSEMPPELCDCLAQRAEADLSEDAQALLLAMVERDEQAAAELRSSIPVTDAMQAGMLMTQAGQCAPPPEGD